MSKKDLARVYEPREIEMKWSQRWLAGEGFAADARSKKPAFSMVIPPPNITGSLHLGHALNNTLQDIMARYKRMRGYNVLWLPGLDHAGIATQNVVERQLKEEGLTRQTLGRERFIERVWKWKEESGGTILGQLKRLGASCDWTRLKFTMDEGLSRAVREVFVSLFNEGLIYRADYIINFCPRCHTALSDLEVEHEERDSFLYHIDYPLKEGGGITVATTRPETMLGDMAVAVNPEDDRYKHLIGSTVRLPLVNREIPVIADRAVEAAFGTGAVKITPAHDFNDFETAKRHGLKPLTVMDDTARMNENAGPYRGLTSLEARERVVNDLKEAGLLKKEERYRVPAGLCYRCGTVVEPTLSKQWFVKVAPLAKPAMEAVREGRIRFVPENWERTYFDWMLNIRDWCISRQIWWGHRIPAWHCRDCGHITVSREDPRGCGRCKGGNIEQDPDVLDTWFSSALWPFSTLGWPEKTPEEEAFYPTSALFTSFDIIFFWVARMIMMGLKFKGDVPFREVYIHALVRDAEGQKMSKSKGNVIDPVVMMDRYGTDALRFTLAAFAAQGRDIKLAEERIEGYRNFANKLWNLARFTLMNIAGEGGDEKAGQRELTDADRWIITRLSSCIEEVSGSLDRYEFDRAANAIYSFVWHELCDWYVELIKPDLRGEKGEKRKQASADILLGVMKDTMRLLHPFMPFITEEIYSYLPDVTPGIIKEGFPEPPPKYPGEAAATTVVMDVIRAVRNIRTEMNIPLSTALDCLCFSKDPAARRALELGEAYVKSLARVSVLKVSGEGERPVDAAFAVVGGGGGVEGIAGIEVFVPLKGHVDIAGETSRLIRGLEKVERELAGVEGKLGNGDFLNNAPASVVEKEKEKMASLLEKKVKIGAGLERIRGLKG
ncbi:MAG: valine--tRNA ligase [Deltaproteobacteria bacterium]|nr:valine--tRNA ligase [Deltaproteobacteria bacterium]